MITLLITYHHLALPPPLTAINHSLTNRTNYNGHMISHIMAKYRSAESYPARNSQTIFYSHWIPIDSTHKHYTTLHNNSNAQLIQCPECNKGLSGSPNFAPSATCVIKCTAKVMGKIDHVKITKTQSSANPEDHRQVAHFPVHIQFFFNLLQSKRF